MNKLQHFLRYKTLWLVPILLVFYFIILGLSFLFPDVKVLDYIGLSTLFTLAVFAVFGTIWGMTRKDE